MSSALAPRSLNPRPSLKFRSRDLPTMRCSLGAVRRAAARSARLWSGRTVVHFCSRGLRHVAAGGLGCPPMEQP